MKQFFHPLLILGILTIVVPGFSQQQQAFFLESASSTGVQNMFYRGSGVKNSNNDLYTAGATLDGTGHYNILITKHNSSNVLQWTAEYAGSYGGDDYAADIAFDANGDILVVGTVQTGTLNYDAIVLKYNTSGTQQWVQTYSGAANLADGFTTVETDANNNVYCSGGSVESVSSLTDIVTRKYNSSGTLIWSYIWNSTYSLQDASYRILFASGNVNVYGASQTGTNPVTWKLAKVSIVNSTGALYGSSLAFGESSELDNVTDLAVESQNYVTVCGTKEVSGQGKNFRVIRYDNDLEQIWMYEHNGAANGDDEALDLVLSGSSFAYVTGYITHATEGENAFTTKISLPYGTASWTSAWDGGQLTNDRGVSIEINGNGDVYVGGNSVKDGNQDITLLKLKGTNGSSLASGRYNGDDNGDDHAGNMVLISGGVYLASQVTKGVGLSYLLTKWTESTLYVPVCTDDFSSSGGFISNKGQVRNTNGSSNTTIKFYNNRQYPSTFIDSTNFTMVFAHCHEDSIAGDTLQRINMKFNKGLTITPVQPLQERKDYINFYLPFMIAKGERTPIHDLIVKPSVYANTDVYFTQNNRGYVHYIVCRSGSPTADIEMEFNGQDSVYVNGSGQLVLETVFGNHIQQKAKVYTMNNTSGALTLLGWQPSYIVTGNKVSFNYTGTWSGTLVIKMEQQPSSSSSQAMNDQTLEWSTYMGGNDNDWAADVACNEEQSSWFTGRTNSVNIPLLEEVTITLQEGDFNSLYVAKYSQDLQAQWLVVYGEDAGGRSITSDIAGNAYVVGTSVSGEEHSSELLDLDGNDDSEGIYCVFNPLGFILCDSYIGGNGTDIPYSVDLIRNAIDGTTDIWIAGTTNSSHLFPLESVTDAYNQTSAGDWDGFLMKIVDSEFIEWATMFGGNDADRIYELDIYKTNLTEYDIILMGVTYTEQHSIENSANPLCDVPTDGSFPTCQPSGSWLQPVYANDDFIYPNYFVSRFSGSDFNLKWSTYFGMASDVSNVFYREGSITSTTTNGAFYITGSAGEYNNSSFPTVTSGNSGSYNQPFGGGDADMFIAKFSPNNNLVWSTFFGSDEDYEFASSLAFVPSNNYVVMTGTTETSNLQSEIEFCDTPTEGEFPLCDENGNNYMEPIVSGPRRTIIAAFNTSDQLQWSTLFGDSGASNGMSLDAAGSKLYLSGMADDGYTFLNYNEGSDLDYYQDFQFGNDNDAGLARFDMDFITSMVNPYSDENSFFEVYPNPSNGIFYLNLSDNLNTTSWSYQIFDVMGQLVKEEKYNKFKNAIIDLSPMSSGSYLITIMIDDKVYNHQLVKQ